MKICEFSKEIQNEMKAEMIKKIKTGELLEDYELEEIAFESQYGGLFADNFVEVIKKDDTRWFKNMTTILKIDGELYAVDWAKGLTEMQKDSFWGGRGYKVRKTERIITITDYERIEEGENTK